MLDAWRLDPCSEDELRGQLEGWTATSLSAAYLQWQAADDEAVRQQHLHRPIPSLLLTTRDLVLDALNQSHDLTHDVEIIAATLDDISCSRLLSDPSLTYRTFNLLRKSARAKAMGWVPLGVDLDDFILRNERYVRSRGQANRDGKYLIRLEDLPSLIDARAPSADGGPLLIVRKEPPKGGLQMLDHMRDGRVKMVATDASFRQAFDRVSKGMLRGLDWSHVLMAGSMVGDVVLMKGPSSAPWSHQRDVNFPDIDLYVHGLKAGEAN